MEQSRNPAEGLLRDPNLWVIFAVTLMVVMGVASVAPALPVVQTALGVGPEEVTLLVTAFTLPGVFLTPIFGILGDRYGRKVVLVPGLVLFAFAGFACTFTPSFPALCGLRVLQGIGSAPLGALNLTLAADLYEGRRRDAALGYNQTALAMGAAIYPALGGALAVLGWFAPFYLPLLALPVAAAVAYGLRLPPRDGRALPLRAYLRSLRHALGDPRVLALFGMTLCTFVFLYGAVITWLPELMSHRFHASSEFIGVVIGSEALASGIASAFLGRLAGMVRRSTLVAVGFGLFALSTLLFPTLPSPGALFVPALLFGAGMGLDLPATTALIAELVPAEQRAALLAVNGTVLRLGQTVGPLLAAGAYLAGGFAAVYVGTAVLAVAVALGILLGFRGSAL